MKTPQEKAKELVDKFKPHADWNNDYGNSEPKANLKHAKQCALICLNQMKGLLNNLDTDNNDNVMENVNQAERELDQIKQELEKP